MKSQDGKSTPDITDGIAESVEVVMEERVSSASSSSSSSSDGGNNEDDKA